MLVLAAVLAGLVGALLGFFGGGGSILTLPMLLYVLRLETKPAIATSLFVVGTTSLVSALVHARAGRVVGRVAWVFGGAGMAGALVGARLSRYVPETLLLVLFGATMLATALAMLRPRRDGAPAAAPEETPRVDVPRIVALALAVGVVSGLVGASGGFLVVPALTVFARLSMPRAIATSLMVTALQSLAGFCGHLANVRPDPRLLLVLTVPCVLGSLAGARLGARVRPATLRRGFGFLVLAMGVFLSGKQLPAGTARSVGVPAALAAVAIAAVVSLVRRARTESTS